MAIEESGSFQLQTTSDFELFRIKTADGGEVVLPTSMAECLIEALTKIKAEAISAGIKMSDPDFARLDSSTGKMH